MTRRTRELAAAYDRRGLLGTSAVPSMGDEPISPMEWALWTIKNVLNELGAIEHDERTRSRNDTRRRPRELPATR